MSDEFKIGDPVMCINTDRISLSQNIIYTIIQIDYDHTDDVIAYEDGKICGIRVTPESYEGFYYSPNRFKFALKEQRKEKIKKLC